MYASTSSIKNNKLKLAPCTSLNKLISKEEMITKKRYKHVKLSNALWTIEEQKNSIIKYDKNDKCFKWWDITIENRNPVMMGMLPMSGFYVISSIL